MINGGQVTWTINHGTPYTVMGLRNGIVAGYSANGNNLIVENITMNDDRNNTEYRCMITTMMILRQSGPTILYVAGEYQYSILLLETIKFHITLTAYAKIDFLNLINTFH